MTDLYYDYRVFYRIADFETKVLKLNRTAETIAAVAYDYMEDYKKMYDHGENDEYYNYFNDLIIILEDKNNNTYKFDDMEAITADIKELYNHCFKEV